MTSMVMEGFRGGRMKKAPPASLDASGGAEPNLPTLPRYTG